MSIVGPPDAVYESNRKLFARYNSIFKSRNPQDFVQYATRFAKWLGDSKAYYPEARQEIISLLLVAQANLRRTLGLHDEFSKSFHVDQFPNNEMVAAYAAMVRAVEPFSVFFVEPSLSAHLFKLRETVTHNTGGLAATSMHMPSSYTVPTNPISPPSRPNYQPTESLAGVRHQQHTLPMVPNTKAPMILSSSSPTLNGSASNLAQNTHSLPSSHLMGASASQPAPSFLPASTLPLQPQKTAISAATRPTQKKIVKKRKTLDYQELYSQDVQSFLQKKKASQPSTPLFLPSDTSSSTPEPLRKAAPTASTSGSTPIATVFHQPQPVVSAPASVVPSSTAVNHLSSSYDETSPGKDMAIDSEPRLEEGGRDNSSFASDQAQAIVPPFPVQQREEDNVNGKTQTCADMDVDVQNNAAPSLEQTQVELTMVATQSSPPSDSMQVDQPYTSVPPYDQSQQGDKPTPALLVASNPAHIPFHPQIDQVLARRFCHFECNFQLEFSVPPHIYDCVARWKDCINLSTDLATTACITLQCFPSQDIQKTLSDHELSAKLSSRSSSWPNTGDLRLQLDTNGTTETIPLSPPLEVTPDNSVDISEFVLSGVNIAQLLSTKSLPDILFVVHVHSPTTDQLQRLEVRRKQESDWQIFLADLTKPFTHPSI